MEYTRLRWFTFLLVFIATSNSFSQGVSSNGQTDHSKQAQQKQRDVESCFDVLDKYVPEVQVHDYLAMARTKMKQAETARRAGEVQQADQYYLQAVAWYDRIMARHLEFAATMINVADDVEPLRSSYKTLPEFYQRHSHPVAAADAIDIYLESDNAPKPAWIWLENDEFYQADLFAKDTSDLKVRVARYTFDLNEPVTKAWFQASSTHGIHVVVNGQDATKWLGKADWRKFDISKYLKQGKNVIAVKFFQPALYHGMGMIMRGGVVLKSGKVISIVSGNQWRLSPAIPVENRNAVMEKYCRVDFDDSKWKKAPTKATDNKTMPAVRFGRTSHPEPSSRVVTPHTKWAKPMANGPIRVLGMSFWPGEREFIELAQRMDCDLNIFGCATWSGPYDEADLRQRVSKPFDVAILGGFRWIGLDKLGKDIRREILNRVKNGAGLIYVNNSGGDDLPKDIKMGKPVTDAQEDILHSIAPELVTYVKESAGKHSDTTKPIVECYEVGDGRVVIVRYPKPARPYEEKRLRAFNSAITPNTYEYPETLPLDYDYYMSLIAKATAWAAKRNSALTWDISFDDNPDATVKLDKSAEKEDIKSRVRIRSRNDGMVYDKTKNMQAEDSRLVAKFDLPDLPAGEYFVDQWIETDKGVLDWKSTPLIVKSKNIIKSVEVPKTAQQAGKMIPFKITLTKEIPAGCELVAELVDYNHRVVARKKLDVTGMEISTELPLNERSTNVMFARAALMKGNKAIEYSQDRFGVKQDWDGGFLWGGWPGYGAPTEMVFFQQWQYLDKVGLNGMLPTMINKRPDLWVKAVELDMFNIPYPLTLRQLLLTKKQKQEQCEQQKIIEIAEIFAPYGPLAYSLGDDVWLFKTHGDSPEYRKEYVKFLKNKYKGKLNNLNRSWGTRFRSWNEIKPLADSKEKGEAWDPDIIGTTEFKAKHNQSTASWMDEAVFQEQQYDRSFNFIKAEILKKDPNAKFSTEGIINKGYGGVNWPQWCKSFFVKGGYPDKLAWCYSSPYFSAPDSITAMWHGAYARHPEGWHRWMASRFALLKHHCLLWFSFKRGSTAHKIDSGYSCQWPDYQMKEFGYSAAVDIRRLQRGLGKLLFHAKSKYDPVAIMFSVPSERMTRSGSKLGWTLTAQGAWYELLEDIGLTPHWVTNEDISAKKLDKLGVKILILPRVICLSDAAAKQIETFVKNGGVVISDLRPGVRNAEGNLVPGGQLGTIFGAKWKKDAENNETRNVLGMGKVVVDPETKITAGKPLRNKGGIPVWITNTIERGKALLLNFSVANYTGGNRKGRSCGYKDNAAGKRSFVIRNRMREYLANCGVKANVSIADGDKPLPAICKTFDIGNGKLIGILRPGPWGAGKYSGPKQVTVHFGETAHIYDVNEGEYLDEHESILYDVVNNTAQMFAMLPYRVNSVELKPENDKPKPGDHVNFKAAIKADTDTFASHVLYAVLRDPSGKIREKKKLMVGKDGTASGSFQLAFNDNSGTWELIVVDAISGIANSAKIRVKE